MLFRSVSQSRYFISKSEWLTCNGDSEINLGEEIYLGLDLSAREDLTALVAVSNGSNERVKAWFWKPKDELINHERRDRVPYTVWERQGYIETTPGRAIEYDWIAERLAQIIVDYKVVGLAFDRHRMKDLISSMQRVGVDFYVELS